MTEYTDRKGKELSEISNIDEWWAYFEQAQKELENRRSATFLPLAPDIEFQGIRYDIGRDRFGGFSKTEDIDTQIMSETLSLTIDKHVDNSEFCSRIITSFADLRPDNTNEYSKTDKIYSKILAGIIYSQGSGWLKSLSPSAQMSAFAVLTDNNMSVGGAEYFKIDLNNLSDAEKYNLQKCATRLLTGRSFNRKEYRLPLETQAQLLQTLFATNAHDIPVSETYLNLLKNINNSNWGDSAKNIAVLTEITKAWGTRLKNQGAWYGSLAGVGKIKELISSVPMTSKTEDFYYAVAYNLNIDLSSIQVSSDAKQAALQSAMDKVKAERIVAEIPEYIKTYKQPARINSEDIPLVIQHRPDALNAVSNFSTHTLFDILSNPQSRTLSKSTQLRMMTRISQDKGFTKNDYRLAEFLKRANELGSVSTDMNAFMTAIEPLVATTAQRYEKAQKESKEYQIACQESNEAFDALKENRSAGDVFSQLLEHRKRLTELRTEKDLSVSDETIDRIFQDALAGKPVQLEYRPVSGLGGLFTSKKEKERQKRLSDSVSQLNNILPRIADHGEILKSLGSPLNESTYREQFLPMLRKKEQLYDDKSKAARALETQARFAHEIIQDYEKHNLGREFQLLQNATAEKTAELRSRARMDLAFRFQGQEFNGEVMPGLAEEDRQAQQIYESKTKALKERIKAGQKKDMEDRGVYQKPDLEKPNETGTPMTPEGTEQIRKDMKDLKKYTKLADGLAAKTAARSKKATR